MAHVSKSILLIIWTIVMFLGEFSFAESERMRVFEAKKLCAPSDFNLDMSAYPSSGQQNFFNDVKNEFWQICAEKLSIETPNNTKFYLLSANQEVNVSAPKSVANEISDFKEMLEERFSGVEFIISMIPLSSATVSSDINIKARCLEVVVPGYKNAVIYCSSDPENVTTTANNRCIATHVEGSKVDYNITGKVIECLKEGMDRLFVDYSNDDSKAGIFQNLSLNSFHKFQQSFRGVVKICLILYVIFFGIKVITSENTPEKSDIFAFLLKFVIVLYFAVGISPDKVTSGRIERQDGVTQLLKPVFFNMTDFLSNLVLNASMTNENQSLTSSQARSGVCNLSTDYDSEFQYLAIWDKIDCRLINYVGIARGFLAKLFCLVLSLEIVSFLILVTIFVFLLSIIVFFIQIYAFSLITLTVLTFIAPLFVTCILFERTKGFFDNWLKLCVSFVLQPLIIVIFISLTLFTLDMLVFKGCNVVTDQFGYISIPTGSNASSLSPELDAAGVEFPVVGSCESSIGYLLYNIENWIEIKSYLFIEIMHISPQAQSNLISRLMDLFELFMFLSMFSLFAESLGSFATDLTDGIAVSQMTFGAKALFNFIKEQAISKLKGKLPGNNN